MDFTQGFAINERAVREFSQGTYSTDIPVKHAVFSEHCASHWAVLCSIDVPHAALGGHIIGNDFDFTSGKKNCCDLEKLRFHSVTNMKYRIYAAIIFWQFVLGVIPHPALPLT